MLMAARCLAQGNEHARLESDEHMAVVEEFCMKLELMTCVPEP